LATVTIPFSRGGSRIRMPKLYDLSWEKPVTLVERYLRMEVDERVDAHGRVQTALDPAEVERVLTGVDRVFKEFRARFIGKCSPVHFFWGSFDLAVSRFSGRRAPERKDADSITREGYSHEVISCGFWPVIVMTSPTAASSALSLSLASPIPMFTTILSI